MNDTVLDVRQAAVVSLGRLADARALRDLTIPKILHSRDQPLMRAAAVTAIGRLGGAEVIAPLAEMLDDENWVVRIRAEEIIMEKLDGLTRMEDPETVRMLIRLLAVRHKEVRKRLIVTISRIGNLAIDEILQTLKTADPRIQTGLIEVLGNIGYRGFTPVLLEFLEHGSYYHKLACARALARIKSAAAIDGLVAALDTYSGEVAAEVSRALVEMGGERVTLRLLEALRHTHKKFFQVNIIRVLGKLRHPKAVLPLVDALSNSYFLIRNTTVEALSGFSPDQVLQPLLNLVTMEDFPIEAVVRDLRARDNPQKKIRAIRALGELGNHLAVQPLKEARETCTIRANHVEIENALCKIACHSWARAGAVAVLQRMGDPRALEPILGLVEDQSHYVRNTAVVALRRFRDERIIAPLLRVLRSDDRYFVRANAINTLVRLWTDRTDILEACMEAAARDTSFLVRGEAIRVLARFVDPRSLPVLISCLGDDKWNVRENASLALLNFGPQIVPQVNAVLKDSRELVRIRAARILAQEGDTESLRLLEELAAHCSGECTDRLKSEVRQAIRKLRRNLNVKE